MADDRSATAKPHSTDEEAASPKNMEDDASGTSSSDCPLFMDGLPSDFAANSGLAAIAALLNDDDDGGEDGDEKASKERESKITVNLKSGGGKVTKKTSKRNNSPYSKGKNKNGKEKKKASLGEAQLFLNMWKI
eukprot:392412_1